MDVGPDYLVMEYVEGATLRGPMSLDQTMPSIQQLIDGIEAAHEKNLVNVPLESTPLEPITVVTNWTAGLKK